MMKIRKTPLKCVIGDAVANENSATYHFPGAEVLSDGSIYVCARKDTGLYDPYGYTEAVRYFPDSNKIIPMPSPSAQDMTPDGSIAAYGCYVSELAPNELIALYGIIETQGREELFDNKTYGMCPIKLRIARSHDNGMHWDKAEDLPYQTPDNMIPSKIFKTKDGIWGFHVEMHNHWEVDYIAPIQARFIYSVDGAKTFDRAGLIPHDPDFLAGDARTTVDDQGNLCSLFWGFDLKTMKDLSVYRSFSDDGGKTWSHVQPIGLKKQITSPFWVKDDVYMCIYQERFSDNPGLYAALSYDGGMTYDEENAVGIFVKGSAPKSENAFDNGIDEAYKFGYSTLTRLSENKALATFWHSNGGTTCVSVCELTIED